MAVIDKYAGIAERYGRMLQDDPGRQMFFKRTFESFHARNILDCACGTGNDLLLFHSMGCNVIGSDLSDSMLNAAQRTIHDHKADIILRKGDFQNLRAIHSETFDVVVCLSNSINEAEVDPIKALESMKPLTKTTTLSNKAVSEACASRTNEHVMKSSRGPPETFGIAVPCV